MGPAITNLGVCNVDHIAIDVEVDFTTRLELALETGGSFRPHDVLHLVFEGEQVVTELLNRPEGHISIQHGY